MKLSNFFLALTLLFTINLFSQIVYIPDTNLKNALVNDNVVSTGTSNFAFRSVDSNNDGEIQISEALAVTSLLLEFKNINSLEGIQAFTNLTRLRVYRNNLSFVPVLNMPSLTRLSISENNLTTIDLSGLPALTELFISYNSLTTLDVSSLPSLTDLNGAYNNLATVNLSQNPSLILLNLKDNPLTTLDISSNPTLESLDLTNTWLTQLDVSQQPSFELLALSEIPTLTSLTGISNKSKLNMGISGTQLPSLHLANIQNSDPNAGIGIEGNNAMTNVSFTNCTGIRFSMTANYNLTSVTSLGTTFETFITNSNAIEDIILEDSEITSFIRCENEPYLSTIDFNSCAFQAISLNNCSVDHLFIKNGIIDDGRYYFINNTNINYVCADDNETTNLLSDLNYYGITGVHVNDYCDFSPGGIPFEINGQVRIDGDMNGCDPSDTSVMDMKFEIRDSNNRLFTYFDTPSYNYELYVSEGSYTVTPIPELHPSLYNQLPSYSAIVNQMNTSVTEDVCVTPVSNNIDLSVIMIEVEPARPGFDSNYKIICKNRSLVSTAANISISYNDLKLDYVNTDVSFINHLNGRINWDLGTLEPNEELIINITFNVNSPMEIPAVNGGDILFYGGNISGPLGIQDIEPGNNTFEYNQTVVNSFDPNDITCLEGENLDPTDVGKDLHYKIRFENTGTASAINIVVKNEIDFSKLDINTLTPVTSSHPMRTRISEGNIVEFIFENINLDFNDATNDGYLIYKIKTLPTLQLGDMIGNQAEIYFDFNFPIITNNYMVTVAQTASIDDVNLNTVKLYPNPANDTVNITSQSNIKAIKIFDHLGRVVKRITLENEILEKSINLSNLKTGLYFIEVENEAGKQSVKLIKE